MQPCGVVLTDSAHQQGRVYELTETDRGEGWEAHPLHTGRASGAVGWKIEKGVSGCWQR